MIISKAIELLNTADSRDITPASYDFRTATKLGLEALKRIENCRQHSWLPIYGPLPGESMPERGIG